MVIFKKVCYNKMKYIQIKKGRHKMATYSGAKCLVCQQVFKDGEDIVVCPECGTPYHRDCYKQAGKCINEELHEKGGSWFNGAQTDADGLRCRRCGFNNEKDRIFCESCGTPLHESAAEAADRERKEGAYRDGEPNNGRVEYSPFGERTVYDKDSVIDGIKLEDYAGYVKNNPFTFLMSFIRFGKYGGKISLNLGAFLFPEVYYLFRKMRLIGIISLIVCALLTVPVMIANFAVGYAGMKIAFSFDVNSQFFVMLSSGCWYALMAWRVTSGLLANYFYYKKAKNDINEIRKTSDGEKEVKERLSAKGGVSWPAALIGYSMFTSLVIGTVFLFNRIG